MKKIRFLIFGLHLTFLISLLAPATLLANSDSTPPLIDSLVLTTDTVDVSNTPGVIGVYAQLSDPSKVSYFYLCILAPDNESPGDCVGVNQGESTQCSILIPQATYRCIDALRVNIDSPAGEWKLRAHAMDTLGNSFYYEYSDLTALGFQDHVDVISDVAEDTVAPQIDAFSVTPTEVDATTVPGVVTITALLSDSSGIFDYTVCLTSINNPDVRMCQGDGQADSPQCHTILALKTYECTAVFIFDSSQPGGEWTISGYTYDIWANRMDFDKNYLEDAGFVGSVKVLSNS